MRRISWLAFYTAALASALVFAGCGGADTTQVVTRTVTEAAPPAVDSEPVSKVSAADRDWAALVERQNKKLDDVARRAQSASNSYEFWQIANQTISLASYELQNTPTAGLSACMADVPSNWNAVLTGFTIAGAADTGPGTIALRDRTLATVAECTGGATSGNDGYSDGEGASATEGCIVYADKDQPELGTRYGCTPAGSGLCDYQEQLRSWGISCARARVLRDRFLGGETAPDALDGFSCAEGECTLGSRRFTFSR